MRRAPAAAAAAAPANAGAKKAPGNTLAEIQRLQKERDERRKAMEQFKNDRALEEQRNRENGTPGGDFKNVSTQKVTRFLVLLFCFSSSLVRRSHL